MQIPFLSLTFVYVYYSYFSFFFPRSEAPGQNSNLHITYMHTYI
jgi:hypothetical protein